MAITFTDAELRTASGELAGIDQKLAQIGLQQDNIAAGKQDALEKDNANKVFYDEVKGIIESYYDEAEALTGVTYTSYDDNELVNSAKMLPGNLHFPSSPPWIYFYPKLIPSVTGLPTGSVLAYELTAMPASDEDIDLLKNGFSHGAIDNNLYDAYTAGSGLMTVVGTGFVVGNWIVVDSGGVSMLAEVTGVGGPGGVCDIPIYLTQATCEANSGVWTPTYGQSLNITPISTDISFGSGARIRNFHPGFTNNERENVVVPYAPEVRDYWGNKLTTDLLDWKGYLQTQLAALTANDATGAEAAEVDQAILDVQFIIDSMVDYENAPTYGAGVGKWGDTILNPLEASIATRTAQVSTRSTQIVTGLGSVSQAGDGTFSGVGQFYGFFKWIDARINKAGGTLLSYYSFGLTETVVGIQEDLVVQKKTEYEAVLLVTTLTEDVDGTAIIKVEDATGFAISDSVYLLDNDDGIPTVFTTIVAINALEIELAVVVADFTINQTARLIKYL